MITLIIGSRGFIGNHIFNYYKLNKLPVIGCDVITDYVEKDYIQIDASNSDFQELFVRNDISVCINCSGASSVGLSITNPLKDFNLNTVNVFKVLNSIKEHRPYCKYINLSSAAVYGNHYKFPIKESSQCMPVSPYGFHKLLSEEICKEFYNIYNIQTISLRIFSVYGEGLKKQIFWDLFKKLTHVQNCLELFGTGEETRDFIHVEDLLQAIICVLKSSDFNGGVINIANGEAFKIAEIANKMVSQFGSAMTIIFNNRFKSGDPINLEADISILKSYGYIKSISLENGIENYIKWAKKQD